ncbi:NDP-hexose 3,4-dehydratase [Candidatus Pelagibacter sp. HTCC7211]|uniref:DegT/DnrJ/EryC1/StrS family aminotransferase n=1 Tax=Pelagibacter sp. (strain HTCC7211) TaxID=439493 RepID=UPI000183BABA|nr:aminotransferase class V-fold PLP-dependent enzyme [Candidatus Pelagibacter sp. HTCC7211]EDZ60405.1 NDP-hexose 3,4-dehydratase [Candidatus Pelagibacter sp. HTCC7211]MBD1151207.1 aminotransferase class V-fold PLP-dependent enzyme [Pelagibacterales bacterium SAG-MED25]
MKKVYYGKAVYDNKEINAVLKVLKNDSLSLVDGKNVKILEKIVSSLFGKKYGLMVNSGSSANLLAIASLNFKKNSEIITPNLTFSTTVAPIYQLGLIPHFIGVEENKFLADPSHIEKCINKKTVAIMIPNLLGNIADWKKIHSIAKKHKLKVIEDSADTIGYTIDKKNAGKYSDITTNSFYASHIINGAGTGGIVCFNDFKLYQRAKLLRGWGRSSAHFNESESIKDRFNVKISGFDYDAKYIFSDLGYNFLPSEISATFAIEQIKKLKNNINIRNKNFDYLKNFFGDYDDLFNLPEQYKNVKTPWLAFPLVIKENKYFNRKEMQIFFEKNNIQTRTIFTGNILKQPVMRNKTYKKHPQCDAIANNVMKNGILLGCHQGMKKNELDYICQTFLKFLKNCQ